MAGYPSEKDHTTVEPGADHVKRIRAGMALVALLAPACTSTTELEAIKSQLADIQLQLLQLQKQTPNKSEVAELETLISGQLEELLRAEADARADLQALSGQIGQLESKLEDTNFRLQQLAQQIVATNQELQAVRSAAEEARVRERAPERPQPVNPTDPRALYDAAYNDYLQGNYDLAILGFRQYLDNFRGTELADNAAYWIGECLYRQGNFQQAIEQFDEVLRSEGSDRVASALLRKGYSYLQLGQRAQGVVHLQTVICDHASTDEAKIASQRLQELGIDVDC